MGKTTPPNDPPAKPKKVSKKIAAEPPTGLRTGTTLEEMQAALREHGTVADAAAALGMSAPNFQQSWLRRCRAAGLQQTPGAYLESQGIRREPRGPSPTVNFRLPEHAELEAAAADESKKRGDEISPNDLAREVVQKWLARRAKRQA